MDTLKMMRDKGRLRGGKEPETEGGFPTAALGKCLICAYLFTALLLLFLSFLLYRFQVGESVVRIGVILIYVAATFLAGFLMGRCKGQKRALWGLVAGASYFAILALLSLGLDKGAAEGANEVVTTMLLCGGGGMLGGMLS